MPNYVLYCSVLTIVLISIAIGVGYWKWSDQTTHLSTKNGGESFTIQNNKHEPDWVRQEVANRLGRMVQKMDKLVNYCTTHTLPDYSTANLLSKRWRKIRSKKDGIRETGNRESAAAYTVNKGDQLRVCVRKPNSPNLFEDENTMIFVVLHEMAHLMSKSYGHNDEFRKNFAKLTKLAVDTGVYKYQNFPQTNEDYCGTLITNGAY